MPRPRAGVPESSGVVASFIVPAAPRRVPVVWRLDGGRLTSDPNRSSLGLLPSGPDPVGEWLVHRQPPGPHIGGTERESKRAPPCGGSEIPPPLAPSPPREVLNPTTPKPLNFSSPLGFPNRSRT